MRLTLEHNQAVRQRVKASIRAQSPGISKDEVRKELIKRILQPDLVEKVYGWWGYLSD